MLLHHIQGIAWRTARIHLEFIAAGATQSVGGEERLAHLDMSLFVHQGGKIDTFVLAFHNIGSAPRHRLQ